MAPLVRRSWAPRGQTPLLLQRGVHHQKVSAIAVLCLRGHQRRFYFRLYPNADLQARQVISFLGYLGRELPGPWLLLWDRLNAHRAHRTSRFLASRSYPKAYFLPAYAPDLNPVEFAWCHLKRNPLANAPHRPFHSGAHHAPSRPCATTKTHLARFFPFSQPSFFGFTIGHYLYRNQ